LSRWVRAGLAGGRVHARGGAAADIPFLQLVIDEHTGTAGVVTRIEAFLELAERRRSRPKAA